MRIVIQFDEGYDAQMDIPWRLHLTNSAVIQLDIIHGKQAILAAWANDGSASYYALETGSPLGKTTFILPKTTTYADEHWSAFLPTLKGPKNTPLPRIRADSGQVWTADNGLTAVIYSGGATLTHVALGGASKTYGYDVAPISLALDPQTYTAAALDAKGALLIAKPTAGVKTVKLGLDPQIELPLNVKISRGGGRIAVSDGSILVVTDGAGKRLALRELAYACSLIALSQDGARVLTYDSDSGVLRSYQAEDLTMTHQRFVSDLLTGARQVQLMADLPPARAALSALTCDGEGSIAFAVTGQVCAAVLDHLKLKNMSMFAPPEPPAPKPTKPEKPLAPSPKIKRDKIPVKLDESPVSVEELEKR